jgi:Ala-tRNA(Pro) deacylase
MIETVVHYLHGAHVPFRLASYPSEEAEPKAAHALPTRGMLVDTQIVLLDGRAVLTCFPAGEAPDLAAVGAALGGIAVEGKTGELAGEFRYATRPIPPLGQLFGLPLVLDERVTHCSVLVFRAFGESDYVEVPYEGFALLEQPRVASFASAGELTAAHHE